MPLEEIQLVIATRDVPTRNALISEHLSRLEATLARTQQAAASLRSLLQPPAASTQAVIEHRQVPATPALAVRDTLVLEDAASWFQGALGELYATAAAQDLTLSGVAGGIYASRLFTHERGEATVYLPCAGRVRPTGRVAPLAVPRSRLRSLPTSGPAKT